MFFVTPKIYSYNSRDGANIIAHGENGTLYIYFSFSSYSFNFYVIGSK